MFVFAFSRNCWRKIYKTYGNFRQKLSDDFLENQHMLNFATVYCKRQNLQQPVKLETIFVKIFWWPQILGDFCKNSCFLQRFRENICFPENFCENVCQTLLMSKAAWNAKHTIIFAKTVSQVIFGKMYMFFYLREKRFFRLNPKVFSSPT